MSDYRLPMDENNRICTSNLDSNDVEYVLKNAYNCWTNEVPANTPKFVGKKRTRTGKGASTYLKFEGFTLRDQFPQNVCKVGEDRNAIIVACESFEVRENERSEKQMFVTGRKFEVMRNIYNKDGNPYAGSSATAGFYEAKILSKDTETWPATSVQNKCVAFPYRYANQNPDILFKKNVNPRTWYSWFIATMI